MSPVRNVNHELLGGNKNDHFDPRNIIALGIDHKNEKILKSKAKASGLTGHPKFKTHEEELMFLISNVDLNNFTSEQLDILVNLGEMRHELEANPQLGKPENLLQAPLDPSKNAQAGGDPNSKTMDSSMKGPAGPLKNEPRKKGESIAANKTQSIIHSKLTK